MKYLLSAIAILSIITISSCRKEVQISNQEIFGDWHWEVSRSSGGFTMLSNDTSKIYNIYFKQDFTFTNTSFCIIGGPTDGTFEIKSFGTATKLILKSPYGTRDSFNIKLSNNRLIITETYNDYHWYHEFNKK